MITDGPGMPAPAPASGYEQGVEAAKHGLRPMSEAPRDGSWIVALWTEVEPPETKPVRWDTGYSIHGLGGCWTGEGGVYGDVHFAGWLDGWMIGALIERAEKAESAPAEPELPAEVAAAVKLAQAVVAFEDAITVYRRAQLTSTGDAEIEKLDRLYGDVAAAITTRNEAEAAYRALLERAGRLG